MMLLWVSTDSEKRSVINMDISRLLLLQFPWGKAYSLLTMFAKKFPEDLAGFFWFYLDPYIGLVHLFENQPVLLQNSQDFLDLFRYKVMLVPVPFS